jgi:hypothetical protein
MSCFVSSFFFILLALFSLVSCSNGASWIAADDDQSPDDDNEPLNVDPPVNPYLANSPCPIAHFNSYCQGSSSLRGPEAGDDLVVSFLPGSPVSAFLLYTNPDAQGKYGVWASSAFHVYTIDDNQQPMKTLSTIDKPVDIRNLMSGAYTALDADGTLFSPKANKIYAYGTADPTDYTTPIVQKAIWEIPYLATDDEVIAVNITYDGRLAFASAAGVLGVVRRDFTDPQLLQLGGGKEVLSNSFALDEDGGIYLITSKTMYRVQWTGTELTQDETQGAWSVPYDGGPQTLQPGRVSAGSGTTPAVMGFGDQDKLVLVCDGRQIMHIIAYWRDQIPADWEPLYPGANPRIAGDQPVDFGDPLAIGTNTEQALVIRGGDAFAVNNFKGDDPLTGGLAAFNSNKPPWAPYGVQKFTWDAAHRQLVSAWANPTISCPNGVPAMSSASRLAYCIGQRASIWTLEAIDWDTGASAFHVNLGESLEYNSFWANIEIGPDRNVITGTFLGTLDIRPR